MKVFVSSLISGFESLRDAAAAAISTLGHQPVRAEDFPASPTSPQQACLAGVRDADAVLLILGDRYGYVQKADLSATHEEYREARETRPVLVFVQRDVVPEARQAEFIREVQSWEGGHYTATFADASELRDRVTRALHEFTLANEAAPLNEEELVSRAQALLPAGQSSRPTVILSLASGPTRAVIRPSELENPGLRERLLAEALTGEHAVLTTTAGTETQLAGDAVQLVQQQAGRLVHLDESARILVMGPATDWGRSAGGISSIIEEDVHAFLARSLRFCAKVLDHVDAPGRLTHLVPVVCLTGAGYTPWRTREEQQRSPHSASMGMRSTDKVVVALTPAIRRRPALVHENSQLADDLVARLRRELVR